MGLDGTGSLPWMYGRGGCLPALLRCRTPMTSVMSRHQCASLGRGNSLWVDEPPNGSVPPLHLSGRCWLGLREGLDPPSRDNAESLPDRAKFCCAYQLFISLFPFTDFGYVYVNSAGALSLCRAEATKCRASMKAMSWARSRSVRAAAGASGFARGIPRL